MKTMLMLGHIAIKLQSVPLSLTAQLIFPDVQTKRTDRQQGIYEFSQGLRNASKNNSLAHLKRKIINFKHIKVQGSAKREEYSGSD